MSTIGIRMKECRQALGYSAEDVASHLKISPATLYRYENGDISKMPSRILKPLADFLCTSPAYLMGWDAEDTPSESCVIPPSPVPPSYIVVPDNSLYLKALNVMSPEDLSTLTSIFSKAFDKIKSQEESEK